MAKYTEIEIKVNITDGTCNISTGNYPLNTPLHIQLQPNKLHGITDVSLKYPPYLMYKYTSTDNIAFSEIFRQLSDTEDIWVLDTELQYNYATTEDMYCTISYSYPLKYSEVKNNLVRCSTDTPDGTYPFIERTIMIIADAGHEFHVAPKISYYAQDKTTVPWQWKYFDYEFEMVTESEYRYTFTPNSRNEIYTVSAEAVSKTTVTDKYGLIVAYKPTKDILVQLSKVRFVTPTLNSINVDNAILYIVTEEYIDTAKYIISLRKMYFKIETTLEENICLGPYKTEILCPVIGSDIITMNMGTIAIAGRHQNIMDYKNTDMEIYLPFIGFINIEPSDFMDKAISLRYEINIINGDALAIISADNEVMKMLSCNVSFSVPYQLNYHEDVNTQLEPNTNYLLSEKPFIYVKSYNASTPNSNIPYNDTKFYAKFNDVHGYTQATEIDFNVIHDYITKTEIDEIIQLLETGVFL